MLPRTPPRPDRSEEVRSHRFSRGLSCLLPTLHPGPALSFAVVQRVAEELTDFEFTLEDRGDFDVVWVCCYERGNAELIRAARERHPDTVLLVTAKEPEDSWAQEV